MNFDMRVIGGVAAGIVVGMFLSWVWEDCGDRIVAEASKAEALGVMLIGANGAVRVLDAEDGNPINDCKTGTCKTHVVLAPSGEPVLMNNATGRPVELANITSKEKFYQWEFKLNPRCTAIWPGGEVCKP